MNVQAFITNVSFPRELNKLYNYFNKSEQDIESLINGTYSAWTSPKWACPNDIVLFFHAKTAITWIRHFMLQFSNDSFEMDF